MKGTVLAASAMTTLGSLPVFLLSSQSVYVRAELGFGAEALGVAVGAFFASAAGSALLGGGLADRLGRRWSTTVAGLVAALGGLAVALTRSWLLLVAGMIVLGVANAACQVTANLLMARLVPPNRQGLAFGIKQSAIPLAILVAGLTVPTLSALVGWRWTFALTGFGGLVTAVVAVRRRPEGTTGGAQAAPPQDRPPRGALLMTMGAVTLASGAANSLGSFLPAWAFQVGLSPGQAGVLMAAGSGLNIVVRVAVGDRADRRHGRNLPVVAAQMLVGAAALAALSVASPAVLVPAGLLAFGLGWSWPGLVLFAVVRVGRDAPAAASGFVQSGAFVGAAAGPVAFGAAVGAFGYASAWRAAALLFAAAALLVLVARRMFITDLETRPPARPVTYRGGRRTTSDSPARGAG